MKLAVIPARGGSKRLPGKNIKHLGGKPLTQWTIDAALESELFDRVCVSTGSEEIARVARACGADVPFLRPEDLASYTSTRASALAHFTQSLEHPILWCNRRVPEGVPYDDKVESQAYVRGQMHSVDIDTALDFAIAETVLGFCEGEQLGTGSGGA